MRKEWDSFLGRDVAYSREKGSIYRKLMNDSSSIFQNKSYADVFLYAAILGFKNGQYAKLKDRAPNIPISAFNEKKAILLALVIANTRSVDILLNEHRVLTKIEEYANWGIDELESTIFHLEKDDYLRQLKNYILEATHTKI